MTPSVDMTLPTLRSPAEAQDRHAWLAALGVRLIGGKYAADSFKPGQTFC